MTVVVVARDTYEDWKAYRHKDTGEYLTGGTWQALRAKDCPWVPAPVPILEGDLVFQGFKKSSHGGAFFFQGETQFWWTSVSCFSRFIPLMTKGVYRGRFTLIKQVNFIYASPIE
ncbi:hypothetical protein [Microcystis phage Mwe-JY26]